MNYYQKYLKYKNKYLQLQLQKGGNFDLYRDTITYIIGYLLNNLGASADNKKLLLYNIIIYGGIIIFSTYPDELEMAERRETLNNIMINILDIIGDINKELYNELIHSINIFHTIELIFFYYKFYPEIINLNIDSFLYKGNSYSINEFFNLIFILIKKRDISVCKIYLNNRIIINEEVVRLNITIPNSLIEHRGKLFNYLNQNINNKENFYDINVPPIPHRNYIPQTSLIQPPILDQSNLDYKPLNFNFILFKLGELNSVPIRTIHVNREDLSNITIVYDKNNINKITVLEIDRYSIDNPKLNIFEILYNCIDDIDILNNIFSECYATNVLPTTYRFIQNSRNNNFMNNAHLQELLNRNLLVNPIWSSKIGKELIVHALPSDLISSFRSMYKLDFFKSSIPALRGASRDTLWIYPSLTDHPGILLELNNYNRIIKLLSLNIAECDLFYSTVDKPQQFNSKLIPFDSSIEYYYKRIFKVFYLLIKVLDKENIEICFLQEFLQPNNFDGALIDHLGVNQRINFNSSCEEIFTFLQNLLRLVGYEIYTMPRPIPVYYNAIICKNNYIVDPPEEFNSSMLKGIYINNTYFCSLKFTSKYILDMENTRGRDNEASVRTFDLYMLGYIANMFNLQKLCDKIVIMGDFNLGNSNQDGLRRHSLFSNYIRLSDENELDHALIITRDQLNDILFPVNFTSLFIDVFRQKLIDYYDNPINNLFFFNWYSIAYHMPMIPVNFININTFLNRVIINPSEFGKWLRVFCKLIQNKDFLIDADELFFGPKVRGRGRDTKNTRGRKTALSEIFVIAEPWYTGNLSDPVPDNGIMFSLIKYLESIPSHVNTDIESLQYASHSQEIRLTNKDVEIPWGMPFQPIILKPQILKTNSFNRFNELQDLTINNFNITQIQYNAFTTSLTLLDLEYNQIQELQPGIFDNLPLLKFLLLRYNKISGLQPLYMSMIPSVGIFNNLSSLQELSLSYNNIQELQPGIFDNLQLLKRLRLDNNKIKELRPNIFNNLSSLRELYLDNNKINKIFPNTFDNLLELKELCLYSNEINEIYPNTFNNLPLLEDLRLYYNEIKEIPQNIFYNSPMLKNLWFFKNKITELQPNQYYGLSPRVIIEI